FRRYRERKNSEGYDGARVPHCRDEVRALQSEEIRGSLRRSIEGAVEEEAGRREDRSAEGARAGQGHQSHGRLAAKREQRARRRRATEAAAQQRAAPHGQTSEP